MGRKSKVSSEIKVKVVQEYLADLKTMSQITYELDINYRTIQEWVRKYKLVTSRELLKIKGVQIKDNENFKHQVNKNL